MIHDEGHKLHGAFWRAIERTFHDHKLLRLEIPIGSGKYDKSRRYNIRAKLEEGTMAGYSQFDSFFFQHAQKQKSGYKEWNEILTSPRFVNFFLDRADRIFRKVSAAKAGRPLQIDMDCGEGEQSSEDADEVGAEANDGKERYFANIFLKPIESFN